MNNKDIVNYLLANPNFLIKHKEVLLSANLGNITKKDVLSISNYQTKLLQQENNNLQKDLSELVEVAKFNYHEHLKMQKFILLLIKQNNSKDFYQMIREYLLTHFNLLESRLIIWEENNINKTNKAKIMRYLNKKPYCGAMNNSDNKILFSKKNTSVAIMPIKSFAYGILAISSNDDRFLADNIASDLLLFLADTVYLLLQKLSNEKHSK